MNESDESADRSSRPHPGRRVFMLGAGVVGFGLTTGAVTPATSSNDTDDTAGATETEGEAEPEADAAAEDGEPTTIDACTVIDEPGEYELVTDLSPDSLDQPACIVVDGEDVTVHGGGHTIDVSETEFKGLDSGRDTGCIAVHPYAEDGPNEPTFRAGTAVHDVTLRGGDAGLDVQFTDDGEYTDITAVENGAGFQFWVSGATLQNCEATDNDVGIYLDGNPDVYGGSQAAIADCTFRSNDGQGIWINHDSTAGVVDSRIVQNDVGVGTSVAAQDSTVSGCHICRNTEYGVNARSAPADGDGDDSLPATQSRVNAVSNYWGEANGPSSHGDPEEPYEDPETGRPADGDGDAISESLEPGVASVSFDPFHEATLDDVGADR